MSQGNLEVRGYTSFNRQASYLLKTASTVADASLVLGVALLAIKLFKLHPIPHIGQVGGFVFFAGLYRWVQKRFLGITLGHRIWGLRQIDHRLYQQAYLTLGVILTGITLTFSTLILTGLAFHETIIKNPLWIKTSPWEITPFVPTGDQWSIQPFFYTLGGWPREFQGRPIFYSIYYEKGPPTRFIGHIVAHWQHPDISLIIEGPKTPNSAELQTNPQEKLRSCFLSSSYACLFDRETALTRHLDEMQKIAQDWTVSWFSVSDSSLALDEQTQGIYLSAEGSEKIQDRFILIGNTGIHQTLILNRPKTPAGTQAFDLVKNLVGSLRVFPRLDASRAWIDRSLESVHLENLKNMKDPESFTKQLAEIQSYLVSKISVDPASFESFFHLSGTSLLLLKSPFQQNFDGRNTVAFGNIQSAYRFAQDISAKDPRLNEMQNLVLEARKISTLSGL